MKINVHMEDQKEEFTFPSNVFAAGLECNGIRIANGMEMLFTNVTAERKDIILSNDNKFTVIGYSSNDESYHKIMAKYKGLKLIELSTKNIEITVTV